MSTTIDPVLAVEHQGASPGTPGAIAWRLDSRGMSCPLPIVKTAQAMATLDRGQLLEVVAYSPKAVTDFAAWSRSTGNALVESSADNGVYRFVFRKG